MDPMKKLRGDDSPIEAVLMLEVRGVWIKLAYSQ